MTEKMGLLLKNEKKESVYDFNILKQHTNDIDFYEMINEFT
jgi:hypothetical protein